MEDSALFCFGFLYLIARGFSFAACPPMPHQDLIPDQHLDWDGVELELLVWDHSGTGMEWTWICWSGTTERTGMDWT